MRHRDFGDTGWNVSTRMLGTMHLSGGCGQQDEKRRLVADPSRGRHRAAIAGRPHAGQRADIGGRDLKAGSRGDRQKSDGLSVVIVKYGSRSTRRSEVFHHHLLSGNADGPIGMDYFFWVIKGADRPILIDTGFAVTAGLRRGRTVHANPVDLFSQLGVAPEDEPAVVVTHAHYDHIGNLAAFGRSPIFISRAELDFWCTPVARRGDFSAITEPDELDGLESAAREGRVVTVDNVIDLVPGVRLECVGGHTAGQLMVHVDTTAGPVLLTSDALHYEEELERDVPFTYFSDLADVYRAFDLVRVARDAGAIVVPGHDPGVLDRFRNSLPELSDLTAVIGETN